MTPFQEEIIAAMRELGGTATSAQIAEKVGRPASSVASSLCYLRGHGFVTDGSSSKAINGGIAWSRPKGPVVWTLNETP